MSTRPKILVTQRIHEEVLMRLSAHAEVDMNNHLEPWPQAEILRRAADAAAIMGFMTDQIDSELLLAAPQLKIVACALKGFDNYNVPACTQAGVWVSIVPDLLTEPTAELAIGLAIGLARHVRQADAYVRSADVFECEDWRLPNRPRSISPELLALGNTIFTPHIGSAVKSVRVAIEQSAADNIIAVLQGQVPPDAINWPPQLAG
jgi:lactate dehydrogenase-like 2-hydroxyacid dehydrogenase